MTGLPFFETTRRGAMAVNRAREQSPAAGAAPPARRVARPEPTATVGVVLRNPSLTRFRTYEAA